MHICAAICKFVGVCVWPNEASLLLFARFLLFHTPPPADSAAGCQALLSHFSTPQCQQLVYSAATKYICLHVYEFVAAVAALHLLLMPVSHLFLLQIYFCLCVALLALNVRLAHAFQAFAACFYCYFLHCCCSCSRWRDAPVPMSIYVLALLLLLLLCVCCFLPFVCILLL